MAGAACCLVGGATQPAMVPGCGYYKSSKGTAVSCEGSGDGGSVPTCAAGEFNICAANTDCPNGMTCIPMKWKLYQLGFCM